MFPHPFTHQSPTYTPFSTGIYTVTPGLTLLSKADFGNGDLDKKIFQLDNCYPIFIEHKIYLAKTQPQRHILSHNLNHSLATTITQFIKQTLATEYNLTLPEKLTYPTNPFPQSALELDTLALYLQEDLAIIQQTKTPTKTPTTIETPPSNIIRYLHISSPNYWAPEEKIGKTFAQIHAPVAGMDLSLEHKIVNAITTKGPYVRFAWGITTDTHLNHHPNPPPNTQKQLWHGRTFDKNNPQAYLRIERQVTVPFPEHNAALFLIHPYFTDITTLSKDHKTQLLNAISSMTTEQKQYKGLTGKDELINWIETEI